MPDRTWRLALLIALLIPARPGPSAGDPPVAPQEGVLVLRNGQILRGRITRVGDRFIVASGETDEVRLPAREVEQQCSSLEEAYQNKLQSLPPRGAEAHLDLAEWCLRHRLLSGAAEQLLEARRLDPQNPRSDPFERRLQMAARSPAGPASTPPETQQQATAAQVERELGELSAGVVEAFTASVQPLLLNRCAANRCHGSVSSSEFRLLRPVWNGASATRRLTQRNLHAALQMIDREKPEESPLLTMPLGPHGTVKGAIFGKRDSQQHERIAAWVRQVTSGRSDARPGPVAEPNGILLQASADRTAEPGGLAAPNGVAAADTARQSAAGPGAKPPGRDAPPGAGQPPAKPEPSDPFDPELFNRRFLPGRFSPEGK